MALGSHGGLPGPVWQPLMKMERSRHINRVRVLSLPVRTEPKDLQGNCKKTQGEVKPLFRKTLPDTDLQAHCQSLFRKIRNVEITKKGVAVIDSRGLITAKKHGSAMITAKVDGVTKECEVTVESPVIELNKTSVSLKKENPWL